MEIVEKALDSRLEDIFSEFNPKAIGAASIGQVHEAKLRNGKNVAVKVRYPDSRKLFESDFAILEGFCRIAAPEQLPAMNELKNQFLKEFDFEREAWNQETIRKSIMPVFGKQVVVPMVYTEWSNADVIVMEFIEGGRLLDGILRDAERRASRLGYTLDDLTAAKFGFVDSVYMGSRLSVWWISDTIQLVAASLVNTIARARIIPYPQRFLNTKSIYDTLLDVHGYEIFQLRLFQGDPHLGNMLLAKDGRIGLIDYGQCKSLTKRDAREYAILMELVGQGKRQEAIEAAKECGFSTERNDDYVLWKTLQVCIDSDSPEVCGGKNMQIFLKELSERDQTKSIPEQYVFVVRSSILLRGLGILLGYDSVSLSNRWKRWVNYAISNYSPAEKGYTEPLSKTFL